jgi:hypothetical protein
MLQRLTLLKDLLGIFLHRRHAMALLARIHASNLRADDRDLVHRLLRPMLRRPEERGHKPWARVVPAAQRDPRDPA